MENMLRHDLEYSVSFGDCDPAGIVFYPNVYAWFDRTFHDWLRQFGGHRALCDKLGATGLGLFEASARFHRPMRDGDRLSLQLTVKEWGRKSVHLAYEGRVAGDVTLVGSEVRGLFKSAGGAMVAAEIDVLRELVERDG